LPDTLKCLREALNGRNAAAKVKAVATITKLTKVDTPSAISFGKINLHFGKPGKIDKADTDLEGTGEDNGP
jgi:hypothetical protein